MMFATLSFRRRRAQDPSDVLWRVGGISKILGGSVSESLGGGVSERRGQPSETLRVPNSVLHFPRKKRLTNPVDS